MQPQTTNQEAPAACGLAALAPLAGESVDVIRKRLASDPELRAMFVMVGGRYIAPAPSIPAIIARLRPQPTT